MENSSGPLSIDIRRLKADCYSGMLLLEQPCAACGGRGMDAEDDDLNPVEAEASECSECRGLGQVPTPCARTLLELFVKHVAFDAVLVGGDDDEEA